MTSNPYANPPSGQSGRNPFGPGGFGQSPGGDFLEPVQQRLSVLAIGSLVCGLVCFIPGLGALGVLLGGLAVLFISNSRGRLRGMGLAIAGIILGLICTLLWIFILVGMRQAMGMFVGMLTPSDQAIVAMQKGDFTQARTHFAPSSDQVLTDEMMRSFTAAYQAELGAYQGSSASGIVGFVQGMMRQEKIVNAIQRRGRGGNEIPYAGRFDKGEAVVLMSFDPTVAAAPAPGNMPTLPVTNLSVWVSPDKVIWLIDENLLTPGGGSGAPALPPMPAPPPPLKAEPVPTPEPTPDPTTP